MNEECYLLLSKAKDKAKSLSKSIAINCSQGDDVIYSESLDLILLLSKLEEQMRLNKISYNTNTSDDLYAEEINKVMRKVPKWKKNPSQYNYKILDAYFQLENTINPITEEEFERYCNKTYGADFSFLSNFSQMHNIAPKNHAKVFDIYNGQVQLWNPVKEFIEDVWGAEELKVGKLVQETFKNLFENGKLPQEEIRNLLEKEYSKDNFGIYFPVLKRKTDDDRTNKDGHDKYGNPRYYKKNTYGDEYLLCSQWNQESKDAFIQWADKYK